jgi:hypothetical protein
LEPLYESKFEKANDASLHQYVYHSGPRESIDWTPLPDNNILNDYTYLGEWPSTSLGKSPSASRTDSISGPSDKIHSIKKRKTNNFHDHGNVTYTYGRAAGTNNTSFRRSSEGGRSSTKNDLYDNKENIPVS